MQPPVRLVDLFEDLSISSVDDQEPVIYSLDNRTYDDWGPRLQDIVAHTQTEQASNISWKLVLYHSFDGIKWSPPVDLFSAISANQQGPQAAFNDRTKFGRHIRLAISCISVSAGAGSARIGGAVAFRFLS